MKKVSRLNYIRLFLLIIGLIHTYIQEVVNIISFFCIVTCLEAIHESTRAMIRETLLISFLNECCGL